MGFRDANPNAGGGGRQQNSNQGQGRGGQQGRGGAPAQGRGGPPNRGNGGPPNRGNAGPPNRGGGQRGGFASQRQQQQGGDDWDASREEWEQDQQNGNDDQGGDYDEPQARGGQQGRGGGQQQRGGGRGGPPNRGGQTRGGGGNRQPPQRTRSRGGAGLYDDVGVAGARFEVPNPGLFHVEFVENKVTDGTGVEYYNATLLALTAEPNENACAQHNAPCRPNPEESCTFLQGIGGQQARMGRPRIKAMAMAMCGYTNEQDFHDAVPDWKLLCAALEGHDDGIAAYGENPLAGRRAYMRVYWGTGWNEKENAPFVDYSWEPDEQQEPLRSEG